MALVVSILKLRSPNYILANGNSLFSRLWLHSFQATENFAHKDSFGAG